MSYCAVTVRRSGPKAAWRLPIPTILSLPPLAHGAIAR
jgi:hypothetical protein